MTRIALALAALFLLPATALATDKTTATTLGDEIENSFATDEFATCLRDILQTLAGNDGWVCFDAAGGPALGGAVFDTPGALEYLDSKLLVDRSLATLVLSPRSSSPTPVPPIVWNECLPTSLDFPSVRSGCGEILAEEFTFKATRVEARQ